MRKTTPTIYYCDKCGKQVKSEFYLYPIKFYHGGIEAIISLDQLDFEIEVCKKCHDAIKKFATSETKGEHL